jgi:hypothetical protein
MEAIDLTSIAGVAAVAWVLTEFLTHWVKQLQAYKQLVALGACIALGIASRMSGIGFVDLPWLTFILNMVVAIIGAQVLYDKVAKPIGLNFKSNHSAAKITAKR